jgi:hypothetical protein
MVPGRLVGIAIASRATQLSLPLNRHLRSV